MSITTPHHDPTTTGRDPDVRRLIHLAVAAVATTALAALAGITLLVVDPASGSSIEAVLGLTAAISGFATAGLAIAAAIHTQRTGLWHRAPQAVRVAAWAVLAVVITRSIWSQLAHLV